jgi:hypothetical protein
MDRRQFVAASAILPLISTQTMAAVCENEKFSRTAYDELLRSVRPIARSEQITIEAVDLAITNLAPLNPKQTTYGAVLKLIDIALLDEALIVDIDAFINDFNGPEAALQILSVQPEVFLDRPPATALSKRLARVLERDATLFIRAANNLGTDSYLKHLPPNVPISRDYAEEYAQQERVIGFAIAVILGILTVFVTIFTFGAGLQLTVVLLAIVIGTVVSVVPGGQKGGLLADELAEVASESKARILEGIPKRARFYTRHAVRTASNCKSLQDKKERAACLEASLLLCANAY